MQRPLENLSGEIKMWGMIHYEWTHRFKAVYEKAVGAFSKGERDFDQLFSKDDTEFLSSIGCTQQELYDFVEDFVNDRQPSPETALLITAVRRDYFLRVMKGELRDPADSASLPPKDAGIDGIVWLPRLIEKAKRKLRGAMDANLMYGCGGDRHFFSTHDIHPADFLRAVWESSGDDSQVIEWVKSVSMAPEEEPSEEA